MSRHTTRRGFLQQAAAASGCLAANRLSGTARAAEPAKAQAQVQSRTGAAGSPANAAIGAPLGVLVQPVARDASGRAGAGVYLTEILHRAGLPFQVLSLPDLPVFLSRPSGIVVLAGEMQLTGPQREALTRFVENGGSLVGIGGTSGLHKVFGVVGQSPLAEGWMKVTAPSHAITAGLRSSLHVFGGSCVKAGSAAPLAELVSGSQGAAGSAILEHRLGKGRAILLAPDLVFSILHIQQGVAVRQDGRPAPDGSAPINDRALKAEDGLVLDWQRDRTAVAPDVGPIFLEPVSDELREIILRSILHLASQQGIALPVLWYWPRGLKAVGHISHDTDGHDPKKAAAMLEVMSGCKVKSTWCVLYPGGYPAGFYRQLDQQGFEIAMHYDAHSGGPQTTWSKDNFLLQQRWLLKETGLRHVISNKNHYTRWEGRLDFLRWCEEAGIESDQTRGPSKKGTIGFPLGGSQPYFPWDDEADAPRFLNVLEVNMLTQDLVIVCPREYGRQLVDSVLRRHGVAHFLFHPNHVLKPQVADTIRELVGYGRSQGLEWWTNRQIRQWEALRRGVATRFDSAGALSFRAARPLDQATLLLLKPSRAPRSILVNGRAASTSRWTWQGFEFDAVTTDIAGEVRVRIA